MDVRVNDFFESDGTLEGLKALATEERLEERIAAFYAQGYPVDTRPSSRHPAEVRDLLSLCMTLARECYFSADSSLGLFFFSLRPPVLFYFYVLEKAHCGYVCVRFFLSFYTPADCCCLLTLCSRQIVKEGMFDVYDMMVELGIVRNKSMMLLEAVRSNDVDFFDRLVSDKEAPKVSDANGLVHHAIFNDSPQMLNRLMMHGADISRADVRLGTPLEYSLFIARYALADLLLDYGARTDIEPLSGRTLADLAAQGAGLDILARLEKVSGRSHCAADPQYVRDATRFPRVRVDSFMMEEYERYFGEEDFEHLRHRPWGEQMPPAPVFDGYDL